MRNAASCGWMVLPFLCVSACGDDSSVTDKDAAVDGGEVAEEEPPALTYYRDVKGIIDGKCATCHLEGGIGPMPLTTYDEVADVRELVAGAVKTDAMPPWMADAPMDYYIGDRRLSKAQKETLLEWLDTGAAEGEPDDAPEEVAAVPRRRLADVDLELKLSEPYTPQVEPDEYRCFVFDWPETETRYITALDIVPGNRAMVHHAIIYLVPPEEAEAARMRDAAEEGQGYTCFTGSGSGNAAWLQSYEPGGYAQEVPGGLGFEVPPGSAVILQVHYNTLNGLDTDQSSIEFSLADEVDKVGHVALFLNVAWLSGNMQIPANEEDVVHKFLGRPLGLTGPQRIYWVDLHMHALGSRGRIGIVRADDPDTIEDLLNIPDWNFAWQETYLLKEPVDLGPEDSLYLECHFDNTASHQVIVDGDRLVPRDVNWGDGTTDEMCLGNILVAPK